MPIAVDFETWYSKKDGYGIKELGVWRYCDDSRFNPYLISVSDGAETWAGDPKHFNWSSLEGADLVSHNAQFDKTVLEAMVRKGMAPRVNYKSWRCSANMSAYLCNRRSLQDACEFLLGVYLSKETRDYADGRTWKMMVEEGRSEEMLSYARSDAYHCWKLYAKYSHLWPEWEKRLSDLTMRQGMRGIQIDTELLQEYIVVAQKMLIQTEFSLPWMKEGKKPTSPKAIAEECRRAGIPCPPVQSHYDDGASRLEAWEKAYGTKHPWVRNVSSYRMINKFLGSLEKIAEQMMPDGVFAFGLKYFGAHTGRWSGDAGFNMQNLRKVPLYRDENGYLITDSDRLNEIASSKTLPGYVTAVLDIRKLFLPRAGKKMIVSDLSQIEPRCLAWIVQDTAMLDSMLKGNSPYVAHAVATMGWDETRDMKKEAKDLYALAKARVLGLGYQCGWKKFIAVAQIMAGLDITKDDPEWVEMTNEEGLPCRKSDGSPILVSGYGTTSKKIVADYRAANPKIVALWNRLDAAFKASVGGNFEVALPSGRVLRYGKVERTVRTIQDEETGAYKRKIVFTAMIGDRRYVLYGGLLTENLIQGMGRDVFGYHLLKLEDDPGIDSLFTAHDEAITEVDKSVTKRDVEHIMSQAPEWAPGLPVAAEAQEVPHYVK